MTYKEAVEFLEDLGRATLHGSLPVDTQYKLFNVATFMWGRAEALRKERDGWKEEHGKLLDDAYEPLRDGERATKTLQAIQHLIRDWDRISTLNPGARLAKEIKALIQATPEHWSMSKLQEIRQWAEYVSESNEIAEGMDLLTAQYFGAVLIEIVNHPERMVVGARALKRAVERARTENAIKESRAAVDEVKDNGPFLAIPFVRSREFLVKVVDELMFRMKGSDLEDQMFSDFYTQLRSFIKRWNLDQDQHSFATLPEKDDASS